MLSATHVLSPPILPRPLALSSSPSVCGWDTGKIQVLVAENNVKEFLFMISLPYGPGRVWFTCWGDMAGRKGIRANSFASFAFGKTTLSISFFLFN